MPSMMGAAASPAMSPAAASAPVLAPAPSPPPPPPPPPSRIDPRQVPRAEVDKPGAMVTFSTRAGGVPPSSLSQYIAEDDGNCSPRFMRLTTTQVAFDDDLVESTKLVVGVVFQPLASPHEGEAPVPVVDAGPQGPIRCLRCRAYMNSWNKFVAEGRQYVCSVCYTPNPVPDYYYCNLDANGVRRDRAERAELSRGSVEWVATPDFIQRPPQDPCYLFVLDVSYAAAATGLIDTAVEAVRGAIALVAQNPRARVGIVTYHQELQFYSVRPTRKEPQMFVVSDADDPFVPVPPQDLLVRPSDPDARLLLERVLEMIPTLYKAGRVEGCAFGAAVKAAGSALALTGGKVLVTQSNLPSVGAGALKNRDDIKLYFTEKEAQLFVPQTSFYQELATECAERFVTVDVFVAANSYVDLATTSALATTTGGQIYFYEGFSASKHAEALVSDLQRNVARPTGFEAVMLVRANDALKPSEYYGNFFRRHPNEMELPTVDADKCFGMTFKHEGKLPEKADVCIQCALLYTTAQGERRIRVHTLCVPVTTQLAMIYRSADLDAIVTLSLKQAGRQIFNTSTPAKVRTALVDACIDSLAVYRKFCAAASSPGQLILPEALKLLPLYSLGLIKNPLLHSGQRADERAFLFSYVASMPCAVAMPFVVPRLFNLGAVPSDALVPLTDRGNRVYLPPSCMLSSDSISAQSVYLLDNSRFLLMWVSDKADPELMAALFDGDEQKHQHGGHLRLSSAHLDDPSHLSTKVHTLLAQLRHSKPSFPPFAIVAHKHRRASTGGAAAAAAPDLAMETLDESAFFKYLVEDAGGLHTYAQSDDVNPNKTKEKDPSMMTYIDFLCYVHKRVQDKVY
jgi:protein transport protein SEC24